MKRRYSSTASQKILLFLNRLFKPASWFDILNKSDESAFAYSLKSGEVVLNQFKDFNNFEGKVILDFGCGFGGKTTYYATLGATKVYGVDIHQDFSLAKTYSDRMGVNVEFISIQKDKKLPLEEHSIDIVISSAVFEHIENVEEVLAEIKRVLKVDGTFLNRWHPFNTRYGSHVNGLIGIPFVHLLFSEQTIMQLYGKLLSRHQANKLGQGLLYRLKGEHLRRWEDIGLYFNFLNLKEMHCKLESSGFTIVSKRYYLKTSKVAYVKIMPYWLKTFFCDYEILICKINKIS